MDLLISEFFLGKVDCRCSLWKKITALVAAMGTGAASIFFDVSKNRGILPPNGW